MINILNSPIWVKKTTKYSDTFLKTDLPHSLIVFGNKYLCICQWLRFSSLILNVGRCLTFPTLCQHLDRFPASLSSCHPLLPWKLLITDCSSPPTSLLEMSSLRQPCLSKSPFLGALVLLPCFPPSPVSKGSFHDPEFSLSGLFIFISSVIHTQQAFKSIPLAFSQCYFLSSSLKTAFPYICGNFSLLQGD